VPGAQVYASMPSYPVYIGEELVVEARPTGATSSALESTISHPLQQRVDSRLERRVCAQGLARRPE